MRTTFPVDVLSRRPRRALTILEMLVSTAVLSFIVIGLTAMFIQTQKAFKTGLKQSTVTDAGRAILDMIASDMAQMSDPRLTNVFNYYTNSGPPPSYPAPPINLSWQLVPSYTLIQAINSDGAISYRTNQVEDIFITVQTNAQWLGIGYSVSNWFNNSNGSPVPGVGTLYRYFTNTPAPLTNNNVLYSGYSNALQTGTFAGFHRIADGVVDLKIYAYDSNGNTDPDEVYFPNFAHGPYVYPTVVPIQTNTSMYMTNFLPYSVDIELGILEPEAFEHARALFNAGAYVAASNYLANAAGQVEIFRQHVIINAAP